MKVTVECRCPLCGKISYISCEEIAWDMYEAGALAQEAFADMDITARETLISGMCAPCQSSFFEEEEDEDEDPYEGCFECDDTECPLAK